MARILQGIKELSDSIHWSSLYTCLCIMLGTGILQLPYTLRQGGWLACALIVVVAFMATYTGKVLILCLYSRPTSEGTAELLLERGGDTPKPFEGSDENRMVSYAELGYEAFGRAGEVTTQIVHKANQVGVSALFLILAAGFMEELMGKLPTSTYVLICGAIVSPVVMFSPNYKEMAFLSFLGVSASMCVVVVVVVIGSMQHIQGEIEDRHHDLFLSKTFASSFAAITLSFGGHANFPTVEADMPDRRKFGTTVSATFATLASIYVPVAVVGYYVYGDEVESPVLDSLPASGIFPRLTKIWITFHVLSSYPILLLDTAIELQVLLKLPKKEESPRLELVLRYLLRFGLVAVTVTFAYFIPFFADVMSLVGATCVAGTVFLMPCAFNLKLRWHNMSKAEVLLNVVIFMAGSIGGVIAAKQAFSSLVDKVRNGDD
ncbi:hypothetical protein CYMTET_19279 [Cymbomonas tetramitiformis]|uniref:Amino acid transporter transmembrane domain-containing protein n=1 Tax=Cymbomonas tetramitiformis TaxID=36881 RepID=A0AAE0G6B7_9CHLO|nr:hypothetical protein CYMTET_19279 [Cymbomonas tetramitiformis]